MTTTETTLADRLMQVTVYLRDESTVTVTGERTLSPCLAITPEISEQGISDHLNLTHIPTGRSLPGMLFGGADRLRELAAAVAHLDWDFTDAKDFPKDTRDGFVEARRKLEFADGEEIVTEYPEGWGSGPGHIPGDADAMVRWLLDGWKATDDHMHNTRNPERVPSRLPDDAPNPEWVSLSCRKVDLFGMIYLLAALRRLSPTVADHAAAFLAGQWAAGDSLGEWVWQWREEIEKGEPLKLPAVPSPGPAEGELFAEASSS